MHFRKSDIFKELNCFQKDVKENFTLSVDLRNPQTATVAHQHDFVELVLILNGFGKHEAGKIVHPLERGSVLVIPRGCIHRYFDVSPDFAVLNILFIPEFLPLPRLDIAFLPGFSAIFTGTTLDGEPYVHMKSDEKQTDFFIEIAMELLRENETRSPGCHFVILGLFMTLLGKLARIHSSSHHVGGKLYVSTAGVIAWLNRHYREPSAVAALCRIANMSKSTLMRNFRRATGTTPLQYQMSLRIVEAAQLLRTTSLAVSEVAFRTGFGDINYFGRQFRRIMGVAPGVYRKMKTSGESANQLKME